MKISVYNGLTLLEVDAEGPLLSSDRDAADLVGEGFGAEADLTVVPVARFSPEFLELRSGIAGIFFQKLQNYNQRLVVLGDIGAAVAASTSLHDFVSETNRRGHHLFVPDMAALKARL
ncbi:DUF4180 domain-containing protein [Devosia sp.]|uniref:DUF4180 domain-containing protein n=1 Tax=Devosia sp. TaxID=1871048 RepID=UPI002AFE1AA4|nr:DUF4180 domain-containing protein [Devosia sp.]